jgi:outer membrane protein
MRKYIFLLFLLFFSQNLFAKDKILYLDVNYLLNNSEVGKYVNGELKNINIKNIEEFKKIEESIKLKEKKIIKQKNILKEEEYNLKITELKSEYSLYKELTNNKNNELKNLQNNAGDQLLKIINNILSDYATKNDISLIIDKKNVVLGKTQLDVTKDIMILLNNKIKKINLK